MSTKPSVILFEDDQNELAGIVAALKKAFKESANVIVFKAGTENRVNKTFEALLIGDLKPNLKAARFILCDQDLSRMEGYGGLSAETVTSVARIEGLSIGLYGRGNSDIMADRVKQKRQFLERRFFLEFGSSSNLDAFCKEAVGIFDGCNQVHDFVASMIFRNFRKNAKAKSGTPSSWMCELLERPEIQTRLSLYGAGDQQYLEGLATVDALKEPERASRIISSELSYWLWESILRFPGILLNQVAAASFLNIDEKSFAKKEIQGLFKKALYKGPFSSVSSRWWQDDLQAILNSNSVKSGLELAKARGFPHVSRCKCSVDPKEDAGYYCMLSEKPVSLKNSMGKIPYFPPGADLARIANPEFARVAPWAGLES
jgi:hypothetical protein